LKKNEIRGEEAFSDNTDHRRPFSHTESQRGRERERKKKKEKSFFFPFFSFFFSYSSFLHLTWLFNFIILHSMLNYVSGKGIGP